ncbi:aspartate--tRNA(Asn) ligase [Candidatus Nitrosotenuis cloacae]|uniref:Aspartate--tRNA ligase n=1 Tax=Candidatus Nitrosotenuis cloacae TaxID=1603555 RepID=A0A3G1AZ59_9ARCH|nr:aspartate--tRNA(Asn) ligase [Candidatus Nitrosotenuis cloacae]AJZ75180.1 aspartyl-tRNA synthetase [Candidatus Nitrosotenuis cloacae]
MKFKKTHDIDQISISLEGKQVVIGGWVEDLRKLGKMSFLTVRDVTGLAQIIVKDIALPEDLTRQTVIMVQGVVQGTKARDFAYEIKAEAIDILTKAVHPLPIDPIGRLESNIDNRLNSRALDLRNQRVAAIFKIRSTVLASLRKTFLEKRFIEITTPKIIGSASEGGANLFSLEYFGKKAYLAQSPQLYKEQMTIGLERVFEIASFYRAEKSHTGRHLSEFTSIDLEAAFMDYTDVIQILEDLVVQVFKDVIANCQTELAILERKLEVPKTPFDRITYSQIISELSQKGIDLKFGDDLMDSHLKLVGESHPGLFFLLDWPMSLKPFYIHPRDDDPKISRSFDLQYGYLELSSGGRRLHDPSTLKARIAEQGLDPASFEDHLRAFDWGMPPHSGWGMGLDRLMTVIIGTDNVREVVLYPRDPERLSP